MKKWLTLVLCAALMLSAAAGCAKTQPQSVETTAQPAQPLDMAQVAAEIDAMEETDFQMSKDVTNYVRLEVRQFGSIILRLRPDVAPITVENFQKLVSQGFYDGLRFHRVYPGFMIQGGDPNGDGTGGSDENIKGEFSQNGVKNDLSHIRGVVSMARRGDSMDSASSQFFIMHADGDFLDGSYAAFGYVVCGMDTVDAICQVELEDNGMGERSSPVEPVILESARFVTPVS